MIRHAGNLLVRVAAWTASLLVVLGLVAAVLLARGPISLGFLTPYFEELANDAAAPLRVRIADTVLTWQGWSRKLDVRVVGVRIVDPRDQAMATIPQASVSLRAGALLRGRLRPSRVELIGPSLHLVRQADGRVSFDIGGREGGGSDGLDAIALSLIEGRQPGFLRSLKRLDVIDARLTVEDRLSGITWRVPRANVVLRRVEDGVVAELAADVAGGDRPALINASALWRGVEGPSRVTIDFAGLDLAAFAADFPLAALDPVRGLHLVTSGRLRLRFSDAHALETLSFDVSTGGGSVALPRLHPEPLAVASAEARGRYEAAFDTLILEDAQVRLDGGLELRASGALWRAEDGLGAAGQASFANLPVADLERYWPADKAANARRWVLENILAGTVTEARLSLDIAPGDLASPAPPADMVVLDFRFQDVEARYWRPLPHIVAGAGSARLNLETFTLRLDSGHVGDIALTDGRVEIGNLGGGDEVAEVSFLATAPAQSALRLLDREPLRFARNVGIDAAEVSGYSRTRARFRIPLKRDILLDDIGYSAKAELEAFAMPRIFGLYDVSQGALTLAVDEDGFDAEGRVALNGVPVDMAWRRDFEPAAGAPPSRYSLSATLEDGDRAALGLTLGSYLDGPTPVRMTVTVDRRERVEAEGEANLRGARIAVRELGIGKEPGQAGTLDFAFHTDEAAALVVDRIALRAGALRADAGLTLDRKGRLRRLAIERLQDGANDFGVTVTPAADGGYAVSVTGHGVDLRPLLDEVAAENGRAAAGDGAAPALRLTASLDRVLLADGLRLTRAEARARADGGVWTDVTARGLLNGAAPVTARLETVPGSDARQVTIAADDAGAVLRAAGVVKQAKGGTLRIIARLPGAAGQQAAPIRGDLLMKGFRIVDAPVLARMLTLASLTGIQDVLSGDGIYFAVLHLPFTVMAGAVRIADGRAVGSQLGLTVNGVIDRRARTLTLDGTLVPAYTLNSVLGHIPLIGNLFVGRPGEGVFAIGYDVRGPLDAPVVTVNPLTALAPGFLRRIVEGVADSAAAGQEAVGPDAAPVRPGGR